MANYISRNPGAKKEAIHRKRVRNLQAAMRAGKPERIERATEAVRQAMLNWLEAKVDQGALTPERGAEHAELWRSASPEWIRSNCDQ